MSAFKLFLIVCKASLNKTCIKQPVDYIDPDGDYVTEYWASYISEEWPLSHQSERNRILKPEIVLLFSKKPEDPRI